MEKQESIGFIETCLRILNNDLKHFKLCVAIVLVPTLVAFVMVMWVIKPTYRAVAIVTPPSNAQSSLGNGISSMLGSSAKGSAKSGSASGLFGSLLNMSSGSEDADVVWTIFNSWELHNQIIEKFDLATHYEFDGEFKADLLKEFRKNFELNSNDESMFEISVEDEDYRLAAAIVKYMLEKADSSFNAYKTSQARQSREYFQSRLDSCQRELDALQKKFSDFQSENNFYDPEIQMESTIKYLSELQTKREDLSMEMEYEREDRGENSKRYDQLSKRYKGVSSALKGTLNGKNKNVGMISLKKSPELTAQYLQYESEIKVQEALYEMLRVQSEEMKLEEAKMLTNLHVLEPPWENNKKVYPLRGVTLVFVFAVFALIATIISNLLEYLRAEEKADSSVAREWSRLRNFFKKN